MSGLNIASEALYRDSDAVPETTKSFASSLHTRKGKIKNYLHPAHMTIYNLHVIYYKGRIILHKRHHQSNIQSRTFSD